MSKIALTPNASGTGTFSIAAPGTNTDRTLTLPDSSGTLARTADLGSITHLGTIATTSGSSVTLSGLTLTDYKQLQFVVDNVSGSATASVLRLNGKLVSDATLLAAGDFCIGGGTVDLASGVFWYSGSVSYNAGANTATLGSGGASGLTTASTSITFTISAGTFDAGSIRIYGVK